MVWIWGLWRFLFVKPSDMSGNRLPMAEWILKEDSEDLYLEDHPRNCKWLVTPIYKPFRPFTRGITPFRGLTITMVINHVSKSGDDPPSSFLLTIRKIQLWALWTCWNESEISSRVRNLGAVLVGRINTDIDIQVGLYPLPQYPSWELTYPLFKAFLRWFSFSPGGICDRSLEGNQLKVKSIITKKKTIVMIVMLRRSRWDISNQ